MTKKLIGLIILLVGCSGIMAQQKSVKADLQNLVDTELSFAKTAETKGTKAAFLEFLADDGRIFQPTEINGKQFWNARADSPALLSWRPNWADISSDGSLGYTTGGWEYRPNGKTDEPNAFGQYVTIWQKQSGGKFKAVLDIGITHPKPEGTKYGWSFPRDEAAIKDKPQRAITLGQLTDIFSKKLLSDGYFRYFADDVIVLRDGQMPLMGKTTAFLGLEKLDEKFPPRSVLNFKGDLSQVFGNMMYAHGTYQLTHEDKSISKWNFVQIWKYRGGRWQIVLDIFNLIPEK